MGRAPWRPLGRAQLKRWPPVQRPRGVAYVVMIFNGDMFRDLTFSDIKGAVLEQGDALT